MTSAATIARLSEGGRIWALGALHGNDPAAAFLCQALADRWQPADKLVVLGNMLGAQGDPARVIDRLLRLRRRLMAANLACDVIFLRGAQEEMWHKLLSLQFALEPLAVLDWMLEQGLAGIVDSYGAHIDEGRVACRSGPLAIARWTGSLRTLQATRPGHKELLNALVRSARSHDGSVLLVAAGVDATRPLAEQKDAFWWNRQRDAALDAALAAGVETGWRDLGRLVRGSGPGSAEAAPLGTGRVLTVSGDGPALVALDGRGSVLERIEG